MCSETVRALFDREVSVSLSVQSFICLAGKIQAGRIGASGTILPVGSAGAGDIGHKPFVKIRKKSAGGWKCQRNMRYNNKKQIYSNHEEMEF